MGSITVGELKTMLENIPDDYEVVMKLRHRYPITKEEGERGWVAYINGCCQHNDYKEFQLMN